MARTVTERVHEIETTLESAKASARYWELEARRFRLLCAGALNPEWAGWWSHNSPTRDVTRACEWVDENLKFTERTDGKSKIA